MQKQRRIMWQNIDWLKYEVDDLDDDEYDDEYSDKYDDDEATMIMQIMKMRGNNRIIPTPFGPCNSEDVANPINNTKFFVGHVNFNISKDVILILNDIPGIEYLKIMSRYRFLIGVGIMFQPLNVQMAIEKALNIHKEENLDTLSGLDLTNVDLEENSDVNEVIEQILSQVSKDQKWVAYIYPNGDHIIKIAKTEEDFIKQKNNFQELQVMSNGMLMAYDDELK